jgi:hypothetical protein
MSRDAGIEWDRLVKELTDSNIRIAKAHGRLIEQAALIAVDIAEAAKVVKEKGPYYLNRNTGAWLLHPATRRMDSLRRDYVKVLSLLGLRSAVAVAGDAGKSLDEMLDE